jgi:hypothetical protein
VWFGSKLMGAKGGIMVFDLFLNGVVVVGILEFELG